MYLTKTFILKTHDTKVQFIVTDNIVKVNNRIQAYHKTGVMWDKKDNPEGCCIVCSMAKYYIIINAEYLSHNAICHELYHCVCNLASDRGIHEEESRAWIQGHIAQEIYDFLKVKGVKV